MKNARRAIVLPLLVSALACSACAMDFTETGQADVPVVVPQEAYLREWMILGPFELEPMEKDGPIPADWTRDFISVDSLTDISGTSGGMQWKKLADEDGTPEVDLASQLSPNTNVAAYVATYVFAQEAGPRALLFGSDDGITVWVNGRRVFERQETRGCACDEDRAVVYLEKGRNLLVLKITQGGGGWGFCARFQDNNGLSTSTAPEASAVKLATPEAALAGTPSFRILPYIQNVTLGATTIMWQTDVPAFARITVSGERDSASYRTMQARRLGQVRVGGLSPDTRYEYLVETFARSGEPGEAAAEADYAFTTFPVGDRPITFAVYGDSRSLPDRHASVIDAMAREKNLDFVLHTGDIVGNGTVLSLWIPEFFEPAARLTRRVPFFTVLGNHERNSPYYFLYYDLPQNEQYYSFDVYDVHVICLDSCIDFDEGTQQYDWLIADLEKHRDAKWKFIVMHHPTYSSGPHGAVDANGVPTEQGVRLAQKLLPGLAAKYGIQAVFAGHDHDYERSTRDGVQYIVTGGGGAPTYGESNAKSNPYRRVFYSGLHYCLVTIDGDKGTIVAKTPEGRVLDKIALAGGFLQ